MTTRNASRVVIVGAGEVGASVAFSMATQGVCREIVLIDPNESKVMAESKDLSDGTEFLDRRVKVRVGDYSDCAAADVVVITAGRRPTQATDRLGELGFTLRIIDQIIEHIMAHGFDGIIVMVSNPVDILSWYAYQRSGLPHERIIGTGTSLDTSRLKTIIGEETGFDPRSVGGFVLGEHGESQFVPWSTVSLGGKPFMQILEDNAQRFHHLTTASLEEKTRLRGWHIRDGKGGTNFGIASTVAGIVQTILWDERRIIPISTWLDGEYGEHGIFLGVPTEVGAEGASEVVQLNLTRDELAKLHHSAELMHEYIAQIPPEYLSKSHQ